MQTSVKHKNLDLATDLGSALGRELSGNPCINATKHDRQEPGQRDTARQCRSASCFTGERCTPEQVKVGDGRTGAKLASRDCQRGFNCLVINHLFIRPQPAANLPIVHRMGMQHVPAG